MICKKTISVTGTGRSGTNILKKIFGQHSSIATLPFEYRFVIDPKGVVDFYQTFTTSYSPYRVDAKLKEFERFLKSLAEVSEEKQKETAHAKSIDPKGTIYSAPAYAGWELNQWIPGFDKFIDELMLQLISFKYSAVWPGTDGGIENNEMYFSEIQKQSELVQPLQAFLQSCFDAICSAQQKSILLEDNTHNLLYAKPLCELVPSLQHIHVVRDPRDVISSLITQRWAPSEIKQAVSWYKSVMSGWQKQKDLLSNGQFIEIKFEDLIHSTESTLQSICDFVGIRFESEMLEIDLSKHNIGRYKSELSKDDIAYIENELSSIMSTYNYEV